MKSLLNIEKSAFRHGEYIGYGGGIVWRVYKQGRLDWRAFPRNAHEIGWRCLFGKTLTEISNKLNEVAA